MAKIAWLEEIKEKVGVNDEVQSESRLLTEKMPSVVKKTAAASLPAFPGDVSALPHCIARSALFAPIRRGPRKYRDGEIIAARGDVSIVYTGKQLDMADQDVFLQAIVVAQGRPAGEVCFFERADFLRRIGRTDAKANYQWLDKSFLRLMTGFITVKKGKMRSSTQIMQKYGIDDSSGRFFVQFTPETIKMFQAYGHIDMKKRALIKHDFTKWLQSYVSSHERGKHAIGVDRLHQWSGSETLLKKWQLEKLKPALIELEKLGIIRAAKITGQTVEWKRI